MAVALTWSGSPSDEAVLFGATDSLVAPASARIQRHRVVDESLSLAVDLLRHSGRIGCGRIGRGRIGRDHIGAGEMLRIQNGV